MKLAGGASYKYMRKVAPHAGAWIEIRDPLATGLDPNEVAPHAGAWIEISMKLRQIPLPEVAPHAGAWIEIYTASGKRVMEGVAPHAGAWIEMYRDLYEPTSYGSRPPRGGVD